MDRDGNGQGSCAMGAFGSIDLSRFNDSTAVDLKGQVHQLPCCIKYDGPSSVSHYFKPKSTGPPPPPPSIYIHTHTYTQLINEVRLE